MISKLLALKNIFGFAQIRDLVVPSTSFTQDSAPLSSNWPTRKSDHTFENCTFWKLDNNCQIRHSPVPSWQKCQFCTTYSNRTSTDMLWQLTSKIVVLVPSYKYCAKGNYLLRLQMEQLISISTNMYNTDIGRRMRNFCLHLQYRNILHSPADVCTTSYSYP